MNIFQKLSTTVTYLKTFRYRHFIKNTLSYSFNIYFQLLTLGFIMPKLSSLSEEEM